MIPIGTDRLRAALQWLRIDADGDQKADDVAVRTGTRARRRSSLFAEDGNRLHAGSTASRQQRGNKADRGHHD